MMLLIVQRTPSEENKRKTSSAICGDDDTMKTNAGNKILKQLNSLFVVINVTFANI